MGLHGLPKVYHSTKMTKKVPRLPSKGLVRNGTDFINRIKELKKNVNKVCNQNNSSYRQK